MARSLLFNLLFYVTTTLFVVLGSPLLFAPRSWAMAALAVHARFELWLLKVIVGLKVEVRGKEKLPEGACLVASKHQSAWETFALIPLFRDPALLMKRELFWIPFHGWFSKKFEMIPVDRDKGPAALRRMLREAKTRVEDGREIIIFPEGTRRAAGGAAGLQDGSCPALRSAPHPLRPGRAQFGPLLAEAQPRSPPRHCDRRVPRSHPAGLAEGRIHEPTHLRHRDRLGPPNRRSKTQGIRQYAGR